MLFKNVDNNETRKISQFPYDRHCCQKGNESCQSMLLSTYIAIH